MDDQNAAAKVKSRFTISVIIPTYNGAKRIPNVLSALTIQDHDDFKVIVVIDGSTDRTRQAIEAFNNKLNIEIIEQSNQGRAGARNAGLAQTNSELIVFVDDDMRPEPNWLTMHIRHHHQHPGSAMVGVQQSDPLRARTDFHRYLAVRSAQWMANCATDNTPMNSTNLFFTSANCSMPLSVFQIVNGFDATLNDAEDFDLGYRLLKSGIPIYFNPQCIAWHDDFANLKKYILRQRQYRNAWFNLIHKKPEILSDTTRFDPASPKGIKGAFFKFFAHRCWIRAANHRFLRKILPLKLRFKMYDYIIASLGRFNMQVKID